MPRILVMDDEETLRELIAVALRLDGHEVDTASDGGSGLEMLKGSCYDLIITDLKMPGLDGRGFFLKVMEERPELLERLLFVTGDTVDMDSLKLLKEMNRPFIEKPFTINRIKKVVSGLLATGRPEVRCR